MAKLDAVILAAGLSRRMGRDKLLLPLGDSTLFHHVLSRFPFTHFSRTVVVAAKEEIAGICSEFPILVCHNHSPEQGQAHSISLGLKATSAENRILFSVADQPLVEAETISRLVALSTSYPDRIIQPRIGRIPCNPVIFPADLRTELHTLRGDCGGREIIRSHPARVKWLQADSAWQFLDIDTPEQYRQLLEQWRSHH